MRKSRLIILPARCLAQLGFLLLYLSCPILAEMSRGQPDSDLPASFQLQMLEHCSSPPEDPGDGGCLDRRIDPVKMTWPETSATCSSIDVFFLDNTCSPDERPGYARKAPRRLLAARYTDPTSAPSPKLQPPRRPIKFRSLKRHQTPEEPKAADTRYLPSAASLSAEMRSSRNSAEHNRSLMYRRVSELDNSRRMANRVSFERDSSRRMSSERQSSRRISAEVHNSRTSSETHSAQRISQVRSISESDRTRRSSIERFSSRTSVERRFSEIPFERRTYELRNSREYTLKTTRMDPRKTHLPTQLSTDFSDYSKQSGADQRLSRNIQSTLTPASRRLKRSVSENKMDSERKKSVHRDTRSSSSEGQNASLLTDRLSVKTRQRLSSLDRRSSEERRSFLRMSSESLNSRNIQRTRDSRRSAERRVDRFTPLERRTFAERRSARSSPSLIPADRQFSEERLSGGIKSLPTTSAERRGSDRVQERFTSSTTARMIERRMTRNLKSGHYNADVLISRSVLNESKRSSAERTLPVRNSLNSVERITSSRNPTETTSNRKDIRISTEHMSSLRDSMRISIGRQASRRTTEKTTLIGDARRISSDRIISNIDTRRSTERLAFARDNKFIEERAKLNRDSRRSTIRQEVIRNDRSVSNERLSDQRKNARLREGMVTSRVSRSSTVERLNPNPESQRRFERTTIARNVRRNSGSLRVSSGRFSDMRISRSISAERITAMRDTMRSAEHKDRISDSRVERRSTDRVTVARDRSKSLERLDVSRRNTEQFIRDSRRYSAERLAPSLAFRRSAVAEHLKDIRVVRSISNERLATSADSKRSTERLNSARDSRDASPERRNVSSVRLSTSRRNYRTSNLSVIHRSESLSTQNRVKRESRTSTLLRQSRSPSVDRIMTQRSSVYLSSRRSMNDLSSLRGSRKGSNERHSAYRNSRVPEESLVRSRNSMTVYTERNSESRDSRMSNERLSAIGNYRSASSERRAASRDSRLSKERLVSARGIMKHSVEHLVASRDSVQRLASMRNSRKIYNERSLSIDSRRTFRDSRQTLDRIKIIRDSTSTRMNLDTFIAISRNSGLSAERLATDRKTRRFATDRVGATRDFRRSTERVMSTRDSRKISRESTKNPLGYADRLETLRSSVDRRGIHGDSRSAERLETFRNTRRYSEERTDSQRHYRTPSDRITSTRDSRNVVIERRRSSERLVPVRNIRTSVERLSLDRNNRQLSDRLGSFVNSRRIYGGITSVVNSRRNSIERGQTRRDSFENSSSLGDIRSIRNADRMIFVGRDKVEHLASLKNARLSRISVDRRDSSRSFRESPLGIKQMSVDRRLSVPAPKVLGKEISTMLNAETSRRIIVKPTSKIPTSHQMTVLSEEQWNIATMKTDTILVSNLFVEAVLNLKKGNKGHFEFVQHIHSILAALTSTFKLIWSMLMMWNTNFMQCLMSSSELDQFYSFFNYKFSSHYSLVPDDLATKSISPFSRREGGAVLTSVVGGGALLLLTARSK